MSFLISCVGLHKRRKSQILASIFLQRMQRAVEFMHHQNGWRLRTQTVLLSPMMCALAMTQEQVRSTSTTPIVFRRTKHMAEGVIRQVAPKVNQLVPRDGCALAFLSGEVM